MISTYLFLLWQFYFTSHIFYICWIFFNCRYTYLHDLVYILLHWSLFYAGTLLFYSCRSSPRHSECLQKKRDLRDQLESKIDSGLDRTLTAITGYVKFLLAAEQKKTDFKPDDDSAMLAMVSAVSSLKYSKTWLQRTHLLQNCAFREVSFISQTSKL